MAFSARRPLACEAASRSNLVAAQQSPYRVRSKAAHSQAPDEERLTPRAKRPLREWRQRSLIGLARNVVRRSAPPAEARRSARAPTSERRPLCCSTAGLGHVGLAHHGGRPSVRTVG